MIGRHTGLAVAGYAVLAFGALFALGPLYLAFCAASVPNEQLLNHGAAFLPGNRLFDNVREVAHRADLGRMLFNSFVVSSVVVAGKLALASMTAYAVVFFSAPIRNFIFWSVFATLLLPLEVRIIPTYAIASDLFEPLKTLLQATGLDSLAVSLAGVRIAPTVNLLDTYTGLSLPLVASATGTFLFRQFYRTVPTELVEAARIDGAGPIRFFIDILLPLSKTNFAALGTIAFISTWKDYMWPMVVTDQASMRTITLAVTRFFPTDTSQLPEWNLVMAAALIAVVPPVIVIAVMQCWFVKGVIGAGK
jgi:sn-glycerol 3-phosphate transport system permease protein